jgi:type IV pilus assembly protein PilY1
MALFMLMACAGNALSAAAPTSLPTLLSDSPLYSATNVPANLMLALSVEYPTGNSPAYSDRAGGQLDYTDGSGKAQSIACPGPDTNGYGVCYYPAMRYLGYFDNAKCYTYDTKNKYFTPAAATGSFGCKNSWNGNTLNWATMTALDEFRQALTGGYRVTDTNKLTVLPAIASDKSRWLGRISHETPEFVGDRDNSRCAVVQCSGYITVCEEFGRYLFFKPE